MTRAKKIEIRAGLTPDLALGERRPIVARPRMILGDWTPQIYSQKLFTSQTDVYRAEALVQV